MGITALFLLSVLGFVITAEAQSCSKPVREANMNLKDDFINQETFVNGAVVSFACNPGYTSAGGSSKITCNAGVWSPVQLKCERKNCGPLEDVNNGNIEYRNGTEFGDTAVVICNQGYISVGQSGVIRCDVNGWTGRLPVCEAVQCVTPARIVNGTFSPEKEFYSYREVVRYSCNKDVRLNGSGELTCSEDGTFHPDPPTCVWVECKDPVIENAEFVEGSRPPHRYGASVKYSCKPGYVMEGTSTVTCLLNSQWSSPLPKCTTRIVNGTFSPEKEFYSYREVVRYSCHKDVRLNGSGELTCSEDGTFHPDPPTCVCVECKDPVIENAEFVEGSRPPHRYGASVKYSCKPGYVMEGTSTVTCLLNSQWSSPLPKCTKVREPTIPTTATPTPDNVNGLSPGIIALIVIVIFFVIIIIAVFIYRKKRARGSSTVKEAAKDDEDIALS